MLEEGQTIDTTLPPWLEHTERHPVYGVPLVYFVRSNESLRICMAFRGIVNQTGQLACSRLTDKGVGDHIFTFDLDRFRPVPGFKPAIIPPQ